MHVVYRVLALMSSKYKTTFWTCPLCLEGTSKYGSIECKGVAECGNTPNANAHIYLDENGYLKNLQDSEKSIGIAQISTTKDDDA